VGQAQARALVEPDAAVDFMQRRVVPTDRGFDFLSDLQQMFLPG
jgi:hypothetical protein